MNRLAFYNAVYDLLVATGNERGNELLRGMFRTYFAENGTEWRFQGHLGFGGKFWANDGRHYVSYYGREDWTPERDDMVKKLNFEISKLELEHGLK
jgi:hypothetical protein